MPNYVQLTTEKCSSITKNCSLHVNHCRYFHQNLWKLFTKIIRSMWWHFPRVTEAILPYWAALENYRASGLEPRCMRLCGEEFRKYFRFNQLIGRGIKTCRNIDKLFNIVILVERLRPNVGQLKEIPLKKLTRIFGWTVFITFGEGILKIKWKYSNISILWR